MLSESGHKGGEVVHHQRGTWVNSKSGDRNIKAADAAQTRVHPKIGCSFLLVGQLLQPLQAAAVMLTRAALKLFA